MSVTSVNTDLDNLTLTLVADFEAPVEEVWELWADPRKLERWWAPPNHTTTFEEYELSVGSEMAHSMSGPDGETSDGSWRIEAVDPPRLLEISDADVDDEGRPNDDFELTRITIELSEHDGGTRMTMSSRYFSRAGMEEQVAPFAEGLQHIVGQMDALLDGVIR